MIFRYDVDQYDTKSEVYGRIGRFIRWYKKILVELHISLNDS